MKTTLKLWLPLVLTALMLLSICAHASDLDESTLADMKMAEPSARWSDVVAGIDMGSITTDGDATFFTSIMSDGTPVRFEGTNIAITAEGLTLNPGSTLISLDAVGQIHIYQANVRGGSEAPTSDQWLDIGYGYTFFPDVISVDRAYEVRTDLQSSLPAVVWNGGARLPMAYFEPNFVFVKGASGNTAPMTLVSLAIGYDPEVKYTDPADIRGTLPDYILYADDHVALEPIEHAAEMPVSNVVDPYTWAESKLAEPGTISSDIIAGIDRSSIVTEGDSTFFTSVMSDGTPVRFEGRNIRIAEDGLVLQPGSSVTSLDALGTIYLYTAGILGHDQTPIADQWLEVGGGYTFSGALTSVSSADEVYQVDLGSYPAQIWNDMTGISTALKAPNFVHFFSPAFNAAEFTVTRLTVSYDPNRMVTRIVQAELDPAHYGRYLDGEPYNVAKENSADETTGALEFYLVLKQDMLDEAGCDDRNNWLYFLPGDFFTVGELTDAAGQLLDKSTARVHAGDTLMITIGESTLPVTLPVADRFAGAQTLSQARPYSTLDALGTQHALVIPVVWADQTGLATDELYAMYERALGSLIDAQGAPIKDASAADDGIFSLSEYFRTASFGQLELSSFMTGWYFTDKPFTDNYEFMFPEVSFADEVLQWAKTTYPDTDWAQFDRNGDGYVDAMVLFSVGLSQSEGYMPSSFGGAVHSTGTHYPDRAGTQGDPQANCFATINLFLMQDGKTNTLIHEFSHHFGLNDYYDGSWHGVNAVGGYDMQSASVGDWSAYSKLAVGWMTPRIVTGLSNGESVDVTIGSSALTGDAIVLPAAGQDYDGPFSEYILIDLLSPDGVNASAAAEYGLADTVGVRISHVNAHMQPTHRSDGVIGYVEDTGEIIGMEVHTNNYDESGFGLYQLEVIQAGGANTFTSMENFHPILRGTDLFYAGDEFTAEGYSEFFYQGVMDNGLPLGYRVQVLQIGTDEAGQPCAAIRITAE